MTKKPAIFVVDDDPGVSRALQSVEGLLDIPVIPFASAQEFLNQFDPDQPGCLVLDIKMPGMTGLELQRELASREIAPPIIMISGHADVRIAVDSMRLGAVTLLEKPFRLDELTANIRRALTVDETNRASHEERMQRESRLSNLTTKDREVFDLIAKGNTNKQMAAQLHLSVRAVEDRRARLMKKLGVRSVAELMQLRPVQAVSE